MQVTGAVSRVRFDEARRRMVATQLAARDIDDAAVLAAMGNVPREQFVSASQAPYAYDDGPLPTLTGWASCSRRFLAAGT